MWPIQRVKAICTVPYTESTNGHLTRLLYSQFLWTGHIQLTGSQVISPSQDDSGAHSGTEHDIIAQETASARESGQPLSEHEGRGRRRARRTRDAPLHHPPGKPFSTAVVSVGIWSSRAQKPAVFGGGWHATERISMVSQGLGRANKMGHKLMSKGEQSF
jgi:hypothetical protein